MHTCWNISKRRLIGSCLSKTILRVVKILVSKYDQVHVKEQMLFTSESVVILIFTTDSQIPQILIACGVSTISQIVILRNLYSLWYSLLLIKLEY